MCRTSGKVIKIPYVPSTFTFGSDVSRPLSYDAAPHFLSYLVIGKLILIAKAAKVPSAYIMLVTRILDLAFKAHASSRRLSWTRDVCLISTVLRRLCHGSF